MSEAVLPTFYVAKKDAAEEGAWHPVCGVSRQRRTTSNRRSGRMEEERGLSGGGWRRG